MDKKRIVIGAAIVAFSMMLTSFGFYFWQMIYSPNFLLDKQQGRAVMIPTGATFKDVQNILYEGTYLNDLVSFSFLSKIMKYDQNVKPGLYVLAPQMNNVSAIRLLRSGEQTPVNVTFNNARLLSDIPEKITQNLEISEEEFMSVISNDSVQQALGFDSLTMVGLFIPNTYQMFWNDSAEKVLKRLKKEYDRFWNEDRLAKANEIGLTPKEVTVLASIVQAEMSMREESPRIAGLYMNRLKRGYFLQADPTLVFAAQDFTIKRVLNKHKRLESPFNTYKHQGLPPGPINMPEISSLEAVLNYEKHSFLYMCAKEDFSGYHNFATNLVQHNKNAAKYQRALNRAGLFR